eukprot:754040-Hanusia_phi.AAC.3
MASFSKIPIVAHWNCEITHPNVHGAAQMLTRCFRIPWNSMKSNNKVYNSKGESRVFILCFAGSAVPQLYPRNLGQMFKIRSLCFQMTRPFQGNSILLLETLRQLHLRLLARAALDYNLGLRARATHPDPILALQPSNTTLPCQTYLLFHPHCPSTPSLLLRWTHH